MSNFLSSLYILDISPLMCRLVKIFPHYVSCSYTNGIKNIPHIFVSSVRFSVSGFMLRSLIYLNLSFVQDDKSGFVYILLHTESQLDYYHLLKMVLTLSKIKCP